MENKNSAQKKEVILRSKGSRECLYYLCLFGGAFLAAVGLMIYAFIIENKGLRTYSYVLVPLFLLAAITSLAFFLSSIDPIYKKGSFLCIKRIFFVRRIDVESITKLTVATYGKVHKTSVKICYSDKSVKYSFKKMDKETAAQLRKLSK